MDCCQCESVAGFTLAISNKGGVANWQLTALVMATMAYWQHLTSHHAPPKRRRKAGNKRCVAKDVLLRTFCPFPAQGLIVSMGVGCIKLLQNTERFVFLFEE